MRVWCRKMLKSVIYPVLDLILKKDRRKIILTSNNEKFMFNTKYLFEELLKNAIEKAPGDPEICYHLGMVMLETGKEDIATNLLRQSLLFEKQKKKYRDKIDQAISIN